MKKIVIGSYPFFHTYSDYHSHDKDYIVFDNDSVKSNRFMNVRLFKEKTDTYYFKDLPKEEFLKQELERIKNIPMAINKFLVPEVCRYKGIKLQDLKPFEHLFEKMDDKHKYLGVIYQFYLQNGDFVLTQEQRDAAYHEYKKYRKED